MAENHIELFKKYITYLDEVYKRESITSMLDGGNQLAREGANTNEIIIPKIDMDGLGDYSRNSGYIDGAATLTYETVKFNYDRGRKFNIDAMDNEETAGLAFGKLSSEFMRTKAVPEIDAWRFATYAGTTGISKATGTLNGGEAVLEALRESQNVMDEDEVPESDRILYITATHLNAVAALDTYKSQKVLESFSTIKKVPQTRFYTAIDLLDGKTAGEEQGHYRKNANGKNINFLVIHRPALLQYKKHVVSKIVSPSENQSNDGWMFFYRSYGLADVYENKVAGLFLHSEE